MTNLAIVSLLLFHPNQKDCPKEVLFANLRTKDKLYSCTDVVVIFPKFYLHVSGHVGNVPKELVDVETEIDRDDPDYGTYIGVTASIVAGDIIKDTLFESRSGLCKLSGISGLEQFRSFRLASELSSGDLVSELTHRPFVLSLLSSRQSVEVTLSSYGRFEVVVTT